VHRRREHFPPRFTEARIPNEKDFLSAEERHETQRLAGEDGGKRTFSSGRSLSPMSQDVAIQECRDARRPNSERRRRSRSGRRHPAHVPELRTTMASVSTKMGSSPGVGPGTSMVEKQFS
jgi:hypothetical protein